MDINNKRTKALEKQILELSSRGIPIAVQQTLTATAKHGWRYGRENTEREFTNRNAWTKRSQNWNRAEGLDVDKMVASFGSSADYLAKQEEGFSRMGNNGNGVWVPTAETADQQGARTKPVKFRYRKGKMRLRKKRKLASTPKQQRYFNMINSVKGNGLFWGTMNNTRGMWKLEGSINEKGRLIMTGARLLYSANKHTVRTPATEWHFPAAEKAIRVNEAEEYNKALKRQVTRLRRKYRGK